MRRLGNALLLIALVVFLPVLSLAAQDAPLFTEVCPNTATGLFPSVAAIGKARAMEKEWQKDYRILIFSANPDQTQIHNLSEAQAARNAYNDAAISAKTVGVRSQALTKSIEDLTALKSALTSKYADPVSQDEQDEINDVKEKIDQAEKSMASLKQEAKENTLAYREELWVKANVAERVWLASNHGITGIHLYWKEAHDDTLKVLSLRSFVGSVNLTEKVLILMCNVPFGLADATQKTVTVIGSANSESMAKNSDGLTTDRPLMLETAQDNAVTTVDFSFKVPLDDTHSVQDIVATALIERHRRIHFSAGGGLLLTFDSQPNYTVTPVSTVVTTVKTITTGVADANGNIPSPVSTDTTTSTAGGSANYIFNAPSNNPQFNTVAGLTLYPFGRDTFPVTGKHPFFGPLYTRAYYTHAPLSNLGIFMGTAVNQLGYFTVGPAIELLPGVQAFGGPTWWSKTSLQSGYTVCSSIGTSPSFTTPPSSTELAPGSTAGQSVKTVLTTSTVSNCANGNTASILSGTTAPTQTSMQRTWSFGILFNTNLWGALKGLK